MKFHFFPVILLVSCIACPLTMQAKKDKKARKKIIKLECELATLKKAFLCHLEQTQEEVAMKDKTIEELHQEVSIRNQEIERDNVVLAALKEEHKKAVVADDRQTMRS
jgi:reverse gyrase